MAKIILLGDLHIGVRNDSLLFAENQLLFMENLLDYCKKEKIDTILQLGDVFDRRKYTNHAVLGLWEEKFFKKLEENGINLHILLGNHDVYFKNTNSVNAPSIFLKKFKNIKIYEDPTDLTFGGVSFLVLPWICQDNYAKSMEAIQCSPSKFVAGHLELSGFEMYRGQMMQHGMDRSLFSRFTKVFSGHYHTISNQDNVSYLGSPFELTWADYGDPRGFFVFDTKSKKTEFVKNQNMMFAKLEYDDSSAVADYWTTFDTKALVGKYVKLVVVHKKDSYQFDRLVDSLYQCNLEDFKIIEDYEDLVGGDIDDDVALEDSMGLVDTYIDASETTADKNKLKTMMKSLYVSALEIVE